MGKLVQSCEGHKTINNQNDQILIVGHMFVGRNEHKWGHLGWWKEGKLDIATCKNQNPFIVELFDNYDNKDNPT